MKIKIEGSKELLAKLDKLSKLDWEAINSLSLRDMYNRAFQLTPYRTGQLRDSRYVEGKDTFGYSAEYAAHVEYGHRTRNGGYVAGKHFLQQNVQTQMPIYLRDIQDRIEVLTK